nr:MAG TPA: hypothetical protein [Caudoviricetes sp.]
MHHFTDCVIIGLPFNYYFVWCSSCNFGRLRDELFYFVPCLST